MRKRRSSIAVDVPSAEERHNSTAKRQGQDDEPFTADNRLGEGDFLEERTSILERLSRYLESVQNGVYGLLYLLSKDAKSSTQIVFVTSMVNSLQLLQKVFSKDAAIPWHMSLQKFIRPSLNIFSFAFVEDLTDEIMIASFFFFFMLLLVSTILSILVQSEFASGGVKNLWALPILRFLLRVLTTVFYVPVISTLLFSLRCNTALDLLLGCNTFAKSAFSVLVITLLVWFIFFSGLIVLVFGQRDPASNDPESGPHKRVEFVNSLIRGLLEFFFSGLATQTGTHSQNGVVTLIAVVNISGLWLTLSYVYFLPFYDSWTNKLMAGSNALFLWSCICAIFAQIVNNPNDYSSLLLFIVGAPMFTYSCVKLIDLRMKWFLNYPEDIPLSPYLEEVRLRLRYPFTTAIEKHSSAVVAPEGNASPDLEVMHRYLETCQVHRNSGFFNLHLSLLLERIWKHDIPAKRHLTLASSMSLSFDQKFIVYQKTLQSKEKETGAKGAISYLAFDHHLRQIQASLVESVTLIREFWRMLFSCNYSAGDLHKLSVSVNRSSTRCRYHLRSLLSLNSSSRTVLSLYALYHEYVLNDEETTGKILACFGLEQDRLIDQLMRKSYNDFAEVIISGEQSADFALTKYASNDFLDLVGIAERLSVEGKSFFNMLPTCLRSVLELMIQHYAGSATTFTEFGERLFLQDASGFCLLVASEITPSICGTTGSFELVLSFAMEEEPAFFLVNMAGEILGISQPMSEVLDIELQNLTGEKAQLGTFFPALSSEGRLRYHALHKKHISAVVNNCLYHVYVEKVAFNSIVAQIQRTRLALGKGPLSVEERSSYNTGVFMIRCVEHDKDDEAMSYGTGGSGGRNSLAGSMAGSLVGSLAGSVLGADEVTKDLFETLMGDVNKARLNASTAFDNSRLFTGGGKEGSGRVGRVEKQSGDGGGGDGLIRKVRMALTSQIEEESSALKLFRLRSKAVVLFWLFLGLLAHFSYQYYFYAYLRKVDKVIRSQERSSHIVKIADLTQSLAFLHRQDVIYMAGENSSDLEVVSRGLWGELVETGNMLKSLHRELMDSDMVHYLSFDVEQLEHSKSQGLPSNLWIATLDVANRAAAFAKDEYPACEESCQAIAEHTVKYLLPVSQEEAKSTGKSISLALEEIGTLSVMIVVCWWMLTALALAKVFLPMVQHMISQRSNAVKAFAAIPKANARTMLAVYETRLKDLSVLQGGGGNYVDDDGLGETERDSIAARRSSNMERGFGGGDTFYNFRKDTYSQRIREGLEVIVAICFPLVVMLGFVALHVALGWSHDEVTLRQGAAEFSARRWVASMELLYWMKTLSSSSAQNGTSSLTSFWLSQGSLVATNQHLKELLEGLSMSSNALQFGDQERGVVAAHSGDQAQYKLLFESACGVNFPPGVTCFGNESVIMETSNFVSPNFHQTVDLSQGLYTAFENFMSYARRLSSAVERAEVDPVNVEAFNMVWNLSAGVIVPMETTKRLEVTLEEATYLAIDKLSATVQEEVDKRLFWFFIFFAGVALGHIVVTRLANYFECEQKKNLTLLMMVPEQVFRQRPKILTYLGIENEMALEYNHFDSMKNKSSSEVLSTRAALKAFM